MTDVPPEVVQAAKDAFRSQRRINPRTLHLSTACEASRRHGPQTHQRCRGTCRICYVPCRCECHEATV